MWQVTTPERQEQRQRDIKLARDPQEENQVLDVLENTLWNRQLGVMSEEIVAALVCQIFEGAAHAEFHLLCGTLQCGQSHCQTSQPGTLKSGEPSRPYQT